MRSAYRAVPGVTVFLLAPILLVACFAGDASAQGTGVEARLGLLKIPVAHSPGDRLGARLKVVNMGEREIKGFEISVGVSGIIRNRTDLHESFKAVSPPLAHPVDFPDLTIPAGEQRSVAIDTPLSDLALGFEDGVHALQFSLFTDDSLVPLDGLITQLMSYSSPPQAPLNIVPLLPLNDIPARAPDGTYPVAEDGRNRMEAAIGERGWLAALIDAANGVSSEAAEEETQPDPRQGGTQQRSSTPREPLRLALAPTPRTIEELAAMSDGYVRTVDGEPEEVREDAPEARAAARLLTILRSLVRRPSVQPVLVPYSYPDLPVLEERLPAEHLTDQLHQATRALTEALDVPMDRGWVLPPAGRLDAPSLEALQVSGADDGVFFSRGSLTGPLDPLEAGCPEPTLSFVCPVTVETNIGGRVAGYVEDPDLEERTLELTSPGSGRLEIQRLLAETAMIHAELPGTTGRVLYLGIPASWRPGPSLARTFFQSLRDAPWLFSRTPAEGLAEAKEPSERAVIEEAERLPNEPAEDYFSGVVDAEGIVASYATFIAARDQRDVLGRLRGNILVSEGRPLWEIDLVTAASYAEEARAESLGEMRKIKLGVPDETTFTSRTGSLDVSFFNQTGYAIDVNVILESLDMEFEPSRFERTFPPGTTRLSVAAEAQTSGTFPIEVRVETEDGYPVAVESVQVRSTELNVVALTITVGAVAFLVLFYVGKALRRSRATPEATSH